MKKIIFVFALLFSVLSFHISFAQIQVIEADSTYTMGNGENITSAQNQALKDAERNAAEKVGVYVESHSLVDNYQLIHDEVISIASSILKVKSKEFSLSVIDNKGILVSCHIVTEIDDSNLEQLLKHGIQNQKQQQDNQSLKEKTQTQESQIDTLNSQVSELKRRSSSEYKPNEVSVRLTKEAEDYCLQAKYDLAREKVKLAVKLDENYIRGWEIYTQTYYFQYKYKEAAEIANEIVKRQPNYGNGYYFRGIAVGDSGNHKQAVEDFKKAISLGYTVSSNDVYNNLGIAYCNTHQYELAKACLLESIKKEPTMVFYDYEVLGMVYHHLGDNNLALQCCDKSLELEPRNITAYFSKAEILKDMNRIADARWNYKKYLDLAIERRRNDVPELVEKIRIAQKMLSEL